MAEKAKESKKVDVTATRMGYYGHKRRRPGDRFIITLKGGEKLPLWVETTKSAQAKAKAAADVVEDPEEGGEPGDDQSPL